MPSSDGLAAVTVDAFDTLLTLRDPVPRLQTLLETRGIVHDRETVQRSFAAEARYYVGRSLEGRDEKSLAALRRDCVAVFLSEVGADLEPDEFWPSFVDALEFRLLGGARTALDTLRGAGLALACVANWDVSLHEHLARLEVADRFTAIVTSAEAGVEKPDPVIFRVALERLGVAPDRAVHVGDGEVDRAGALAAGLAFEPPPLATLPARLGLG